MKRMLMLGWWVLTALILWWGWYLRQINDNVMDHHADKLIVYVMLFITFPAGMVLLTLLVSSSVSTT